MGTEWKVSQLFLYCICGVIAGVVGGLLGLGGGFILGPMFLELGIPPQVCIVLNIITSILLQRGYIIVSDIYILGFSSGSVLVQNDSKFSIKKNKMKVNMINSANLINYLYMDLYILSLC